MTSRQSSWKNVSCREKLSDGRFYWEVQWSGFIGIALKEDKHRYKRKCLKFLCHSQQYVAMHEEHSRTKSRVVLDPRCTPGSNTFGVYLDCPEGTLSFYSISSRGVNHFYTFSTSFTEPMIPEFYLGNPEIVSEIVSVIIKTQSPCSVEHTKEQLFRQCLATEMW